MTPPTHLDFLESVVEKWMLMTSKTASTPARTLE